MKMRKVTKKKDAYKVIKKIIKGRQISRRRSVKNTYICTQYTVLHSFTCEIYPRQITCN